MFKFVMPIRLLSPCLGVFIIVLSLFLLNPNLAKAEPEPIIIGMSAPFTGTSSNLGLELYHGSMAYIDKINRTGGIKGHPIVIKAYDDGYNPLPTIKNTIRLIEKDQASLLFNYVGTPTVTRVLPLLKKYRKDSIFLLFPLTGGQSHRQYPYNQLVFNLRASYREETAGLVDHFLKIGRKRIAIFYQIDAYGRTGWDGVKRQLKSNRLDIVGEVTYRRGSKYTDSFKTQVEILRKSKPDAIISVSSYQAAAGFIRDVRDANWDIPIANVSFTGSENLLKLLLKTGQLNKRDYTRNLINSQVLPSYEDISLPAVQEYRGLMNTYQGKFPMSEKSYDFLGYNYVSFEGFMNAKLLVEILTRLPNVSDNNLIDSIINSLQEIDLGLNIPIKFSPEDNQGLHEVYYTTVKRNKIVPIQNWRQWSK